MDKKELFNKIIEYSNSKKSQSTLFIEKNTDVILKALEYGISIKDIYNILISEKCIDIAYITFYQKIKKIQKDRLHTIANITDLNISNDRSNITFPADATPSSLTSITKTEETQEISHTKTEHNKNEEQKPLSKNKQKLEALRKKLEESGGINGITDGNRYRDKFIWTPTRRE